MGDGYRIEQATLADAAAVATIYAHHVLHGTASFELEPPDATEIAARMAKVLDAGSPWLVARADDGEVLGYAYASQFRDRPAYRFTCENSVYIRHDRRGQGIGRALLANLIPAAERAGFRRMIAVIGGGEPASERLHAACGFVHAGRMHHVGRKHGQWLVTVYMQRVLNYAADDPPVEEPA